MYGRAAGCSHWRCSQPPSHQEGLGLSLDLCPHRIKGVNHGRVTLAGPQNTRVACLGSRGDSKGPRTSVLTKFYFQFITCPVPVWGAHTPGNWWGCQLKKLTVRVDDEGPRQFVFHHDNMGRESGWGRTRKQADSYSAVTRRPWPPALPALSSQAALPEKACRSLRRASALLPEPTGP